MEQYAILADIHGNIWALEAVLADVARRDISELINLGDSLYGPLEPQASAECLMALAMISVQGNEDRTLCGEPPAVLSPTLNYALHNLKSASIQWLAAQPGAQAVENNIYLCHGAPGSDTTYLLEDVSLSGDFLKPPQAIQAQLAGISQEVVLCGHSHVPHVVQLPGGKLAVNPGSVGLPAYRDDKPSPHKMEAGSPHARYAVLSHNPGGWSVEQVALPYAWEKAAAQARRNGRQDWAAWLESGRA